MDNLHETAVDESHADVSLEDHTGDTTEEEDATYDNDLDRLIEILPTRPNQALTTMVAMPWKRHVALSPNKMCEIKSGPRRKCNQEAALCQTRGDICEEPCVPCGKGLGIFAQCIVVPGQFGGACGSCRYNMKNAQCNLQYNSYQEELKDQVKDLEEEVESLRSATRGLANEIDTIMGMSFEEFEQHKADLNAAAIMLEMQKDTEEFEQHEADLNAAVTMLEM